MQAVPELDPLALGEVAPLVVDVKHQVARDEGTFELGHEVPVGSECCVERLFVLHETLQLLLADKVVSHSKFVIKNKINNISMTENKEDTTTFIAGELEELTS